MFSIQCLSEYVKFLLFSRKLLKTCAKEYYVFFFFKNILTSLNFLKNDFDLFHELPKYSSAKNHYDNGVAKRGLWFKKLQMRLMAFYLIRASMFGNWVSESTPFAIHKREQCRSFANEISERVLITVFQQRLGKWGKNIIISHFKMF